MISRRRFLKYGAVTAAGFLALRRFDARAAAPATRPAVGYGPLEPDPEGVLALPKGFSYRIVGRAGDRMDDGLRLPAAADGMAAFPGPDGATVVVRNHENELREADAEQGPFGPAHERLGTIDTELLYDPGARDGRPLLGGTTTFVYDTRRQRVRRQHLSLAGTERNCAGGPTPWGSWISCEESVKRADDAGFARDHGYNFEVPARAEGLVAARPLEAMGRFNHEAIAVDPRSGIVYQTEDREDGAIYRFLPSQPGELEKGGRLQALVLEKHPSLDTRNWFRRRIEPGEALAARWIDLEDVAAPDDELRYRAYDAGAARFARGEGMWYGRDAVYFACTSGGRARKGQIFRYVPGEDERAGRDPHAGGTLELFVEPNDHEIIHNADNLTVAPWGDVLVCEDCDPPSDLLGITPEGRFYRIARNDLSPSEFAGVTVSPDGSTVFVNLQADGLTVAITGPWERRQG